MDAFEYGLAVTLVVLWTGVLTSTSDLPVFRNSPTLKNQTGSSITVHWKKWIAGTDPGEGKPIAYRIEISDDSIVWDLVQIVDASDWSEHNDGFEITIRNVNPRRQYLRIVIVDDSGEAENHSVPIVHIPPFNLEHKNDQNGTLNHGNEPTEFGSFKDDIRECLIWIAIAAGGAFVTAILIVIVLECTRKNSMKIPRNNECCLELVENNLNNSSGGVENLGYVTLRSSTMRSCRSNTGKQDNAKGSMKVDKSSKDKNSKQRQPRSNQMVSTLCSQGKQKSDNREASDTRYPRDSDGSWYTEWYDSRTYENQGVAESYRAPSIMKHFSSCQEY